MNQLEFFGNKSNLQYYCEEIAKEWLLKTKKQLSIVESTPYNKRLNLNSDKAKWQGHLLIISSNDDCIYLVGMLRRSFIPPLLDKFDDILVMMQYKQSGNRNQADSKSLQKDYNVLSEYALPIKMFKFLMDSMQTESFEVKVYKDQIQKKIEYLGLSYHQYKFIEHTYDIKPEIIQPYVHKLLRYIL